MNLLEWLGSKKTKDMMFTQLLVLIGGIYGVGLEHLAIVAALAGLKIGAQGFIDTKKAAK